MLHGPPVRVFRSTIPKETREPNRLPALKVIIDRLIRGVDGFLARRTAHRGTDSTLRRLDFSTIFQLLLPINDVYARAMILSSNRNRALARGARRWRFR